jgi:hypothetical protein
MSNSLQLETENEDECEKGTVPPGNRMKTSVKKARRAIA